MLGGAFDAERAQHLDPLAHRHAELGIKRPASGDQHGGIVERVAHRKRRRLAAVRRRRISKRRSTVACRARTRMAERSRAISRSTGNVASAASAIGSAASNSPQTRATTGTTVPAAVAICRQSSFAAAALAGGARLGDDHRGRLAPNERRPARRPIWFRRSGRRRRRRARRPGRSPGPRRRGSSVLAATWMRTRATKRCAKASGGRLMPRQRNREDQAAIPRGRKAPATSALTP